VVARPVAQFAVIGIAAVVIVGLATATASRRIGQREAIADARTTTLVKAQGLVEPEVTVGLVTGNPAAVQAVGEVVDTSVIDDSLVRVKIWRADGRIVYSNEPRLIGTSYQLGQAELTALNSGLIQAEVSDLAKPENRFERQYRKLLEVYLPIRVPDGSRLLFEAYYRYDSVSASGRRIWASFAPVALGALVVLELLQIPLAWSLALRLRHRQRERELLLHRALEASDVERRRIASDLHDGVVQDLAGVAFKLAAARREVHDGPSDPVIAEAADSLRASITSLRSTLVEIYPPDLADEGLGAALGNLVQDSSNEAVAVTLEAGDLSRVLPGPVSVLLYRATREALRNVQTHADATHVTVRAGEQHGIAWIEVADDGVGFDTAILEARSAEGHMGLKGLDGVVSDAGGRTKVTSRPGRGTTIRVEVPVE
jgi:two-component system NarL family sensor kinase